MNPLLTRYYLQYLDGTINYLFFLFSLLFTGEGGPTDRLEKGSHPLVMMINRTAPPTNRFFSPSSSFKLRISWTCFVPFISPLFLPTDSSFFLYFLKSKI